MNTSLFTIAFVLGVYQEALSSFPCATDSASGKTACVPNTQHSTLRALTKPAC